VDPHHHQTIIGRIEGRGLPLQAASAFRRRHDSSEPPTPPPPHSRHHRRQRHYDYFIIRGYATRQTPHERIKQ